MKATTEFLQSKIEIIEDKKDPASSTIKVLNLQNSSKFISYAKRIDKREWKQFKI